MRAMRLPRGRYWLRQRNGTLDLQYYIWHYDMSGTLLFNAVRDAADRGVRVRLLLDDHGTSGTGPANRHIRTVP